MNACSFEDNIRRVEPYIPGEQPKERNIIKLNTNENPYPPSPKVKEALESFSYSDMRLYPDTASEELVSALAARYHIKESQVFVGVGSDDVISMAFLTFFNSKKPILFPDITYSFYDVWAGVYRIPYECKELDENFRIKAEDYKCENGGIIFPNPNAPTGVYEDPEMIEDIIKANPNSVVIIDEAYIDFGGKSCISLVDKYDNLLIIQTFSKSRSLAGMRIGFAVGNEKLIKYMNDVKFSINSYTMNAVTQKCGTASVLDEEYFKNTVKRIINTREETKQKLLDLGFIFPDSMSNFIFAKHRSVSGNRIFSELRKRKIFVRHWDKPRIGDYLRITIGTPEEMDSLISALKDILSEGNFL